MDVRWPIHHVYRGILAYRLQGCVLANESSSRRPQSASASKYEAIEARMSSDERYMTNLTKNSTTPWTSDAVHNATKHSSTLVISVNILWRQDGHQVFSNARDAKAHI